MKESTILKQFAGMSIFLHHINTLIAVKSALQLIGLLHMFLFQLRLHSIGSKFVCLKL